MCLQRHSPYSSSPKKMLPAHHKLLQTLPKGYVLITPQYLLKEGTPLSQ